MKHGPEVACTLQARLARPRPNQRDAREAQLGTRKVYAAEMPMRSKTRPQQRLRNAAQPQTGESPSDMPTSVMPINAWAPEDSALVRPRQLLPAPEASPWEARASAGGGLGGQPIRLPGKQDLNGRPFSSRQLVAVDTVHGLTRAIAAPASAAATCGSASSNAAAAAWPSPRALSSGVWPRCIRGYRTGAHKETVSEPPLHSAHRRS